MSTETASAPLPGFAGLGLSRDALDALRTSAHPLARPTSPFADRRETVWLEPVLEAEVSYGRIVGGQLREPVLRRFVTERPQWRLSSVDNLFVKPSRVE